MSSTLITSAPRSPRIIVANGPDRALVRSSTCRPASGPGASGIPIGSICYRAMGDLILLRHGETAWSLAGRHPGRTDTPLTAPGEAAAAALAPMLARRHFVAVFSSPAHRAATSAALAGLDNAKPDPDLWEWDYGGYEGMTTGQIRDQRPGWYLWRDGVIPGDAEHPGETVDQVGQRVDRVLARVTPLLADGDVALG